MQPCQEYRQGEVIGEDENIQMARNPEVILIAPC
jgi:hypothetical protein